MLQERVSATAVFVPLTIVNVVRAGSAFAIRRDTGEQCFVPASVVGAMGLTAGVEAEALLMPNMLEDKREKTPWVVGFVRPDSVRRQGFEPKREEAEAEASAEAEAKPLDEVQAELVETNDVARRVALGDTDAVREIVRTCLLVHGGVWTAGKLLEEVWPEDECPPKWVRNCVGRVLRNMHQTGQIARWAFYRTGQQERSSADFWSASPEKVEVVEYVGEDE